MACDQSVTCDLATGERANLNSQGTKILKASHRNEMRGAACRSKRRSKTIVSFLPKRAETERMFTAKVLARKEAENRRRSARGWMVVQAGHVLPPRACCLSPSLGEQERAQADCLITGRKVRRLVVWD